MKLKTTILVLFLLSFTVLIACSTEDVSEQTSISESISSPVVETDTISVNSENSVSQTVLQEEATESTESINEMIFDAENPFYYIDANGIGSEFTDFSIAKDNGLFEEVGIQIHFEFYTFENGVRYSNHLAFSCSIYDGTLSSLMENDPSLVSDVYNGIDYAYYRSGNYCDVYFVKNGVMLNFLANEITEDETLTEYLDRIKFINFYDETSPYLAYISSSGFHCPALGIEIVSTTDFPCEIMLVRAYAFQSSLDASLIIQDEHFGNPNFYYMTNSESAQDVIDTYREGLLAPNEYSSYTYECICETNEQEIAGTTFLGTGVYSNYTFNNYDYGTTEDWFFYSDSRTWSISFSMDSENTESYTHYLNVIEPYQ